MRFRSNSLFSRGISKCFANTNYNVRYKAIHMERSLPPPIKKGVAELKSKREQFTTATLHEHIEKHMIQKESSAEDNFNSFELRFSRRHSSKYICSSESSQGALNAYCDHVNDNSKNLESKILSCYIGLLLIEM